MSTETDRPTTAQITDQRHHSERFSHGDKLISPDERVFTVRSVYTDADGSTRVKAVHNHDRKMYKRTRRVAEIVDSGDWEHVVDNT